MLKEPAPGQRASPVVWSGRCQAHSAAVFDAVPDGTQKCLRRPVGYKYAAPHGAGTRGLKARRCYSPDWSESASRGPGIGDKTNLPGLKDRHKSPGQQISLAPALVGGRLPNERQKS